MNTCHVVKTTQTYVRLADQPVSLCGVTLSSETRFATSTAWVAMHGYDPYVPRTQIEDPPVDCEACWAHQCVNCGHWDYDHAGDKCLFMESAFAPKRP